MKIITRFTLGLIALLAVIISGGCGGGSSEPSQPTLSQITITPAVFPGGIPVGYTVQLTATGVYSNNTTSNITDSVSWTSSNVSAIEVSSSGAVTGKTIGSSATITARAHRTRCLLFSFMTPL